MSKSFATFLIICPVSFFLGILFSSLPYDFPVLWTSAPTSETSFALLETHLKILHASPPLVPRILHIVIATGLIGFFAKLYKASEANMLFDGASLVLYVIGISVYIANIVKGLRVVTLGMYGEQELVEGENHVAAGYKDGDIVTREDSLRVFSASNTILALVLVGILVLQAGQWYAEKKEKQEIARYRSEQEAAAASKRAGANAGGSSGGTGKGGAGTSSGTGKGGAGTSGQKKKQ